MENKTAEQIYEHNRPLYSEWGTLKLMCIASMQQYADQETASLRAELAIANADLLDLKIELDYVKFGALEIQEYLTSQLAAARQTIKELREWMDSHL